MNDGLELEDVVMVVEVMKLTLVMEMVVDKEVYVEVDEVALERVLTDANLVQKFSHVRRI